MKKKVVVKNRTPKKSAPKTPTRKTISKRTTSGDNVNTEQFSRIKEWVLQQKSEKIRGLSLQEDLDSDDSEELNSLKLDELDPSKKALNSRKQPSNSVQLYHICEWQKCHAALDSYKQLTDHVALHIDQMLNEEWKVFECQWDLCDFDTSNTILYRSHCLYHTYHTHIKTIGEQMLLGKHPLPPCVNDSRRRNIIATTQTEYLCMWKDCNFQFSTIQEFFAHTHGHCKLEMEMQRSDRRNGNAVCAWIDCRKSFNRQAKMLEHMRTHTGERFLACSNCGSMFNSYSKFYDHYRRQAITNNYKCSQCLRCFATEELLNNHMYNHINCIKCTICDMTCPSPSALTKHFRYRHCKERPYKCTQCDYSCVAKWDLSKHITRVHDNEKPTYECTDCDYSCVTVNLMRKHERDVHGLGQNIYACHCCDKEYSSGHSLSLHLIKKHGFQLPSGHRRFTYRQDIDGIYRVQTTRMESLEVSEQIMSPCANELDNAANVTYSLTELKENEQGLCLSLKATKLRKEPKKRPERRPPSTRYKQMPAIVANEAEDVETEQIADPPRTKERRRDDSGKKGVQTIESEGDRDSTDDNTSSTVLEQVLGEDTDQIKSIDNFSVMQKYLKKNRYQSNIMITVEQLDKDGNVVLTETQEATEFKLE